MTTPQQDARRIAFLATLTTPQLISSARALEQSTTVLSGSDRLVLAWLSDELVLRAGGLPDSGPTSDAFDALLDEGVGYLDAVLRTFPDLLSSGR
jgi:hypothetical protein